MPTPSIKIPYSITVVCILVAVALLDGFYQEPLARNNIREAFFGVYPDAVGTAVETVPSQPNHCGVCHMDFTGGGQRNPYGVRLEEVIGSFPSNPQGRRDAVLSIEDEDPDADGFSTSIEVTDVVNFTNTPTFPGLTPANVGNTTQVDLADIQAYLVPSTGGDNTPPDVTVIAPNGGETLTANAGTTVQWSADDPSGISGINLYLSLDSGSSYRLLAKSLSDTGSYTWFPANRPSTQALILVEAIDNAFNIGQDESDGVFTIESPPGGIVPTTLRDFDMPGSQPLEAGILNPPDACAVCHGNYDNNVEPLFNWQGSMMSQASRDILFEANMAIGNQDAPDSGDLCLRCHLPRGWLMGRSVPTDGSQMLSSDEIGVACDFCHRLVDPFLAPENPAEDADILAALSFPASDFGNGMATIDPTGARRGPFVDADSGHPVLVSPFHREAALCGTCHDVSNPAFEKDGTGNYVPNAFDTTATSFSAHVIGPVERTYSEWFYSEYNTPGGVYAPQLGGNQDYVATCQDCHMRDVTGQGCNLSPPVRDDLPLHDKTGGSTWLPGLLSTLYPGEVDEAALQAGIARARYMLQNAAELNAVKEGTNLKVTVTNNSGHKLPTGYPEGRRMWINVKFYDVSMAMISESGAYDVGSGVLGHDPEAKIYEVKPGLDSVTAPLVGVPEGPSFHFVLNNKIFKDNRIPPRGFTNAAYADFGGAPADYSYADGQYWDDTFYTIPVGAVSSEVTLYYQSTSKEFVEFLRDQNTTNTKGQELYDLWNNNGKCPPEIMAQVQVSLLDCHDVDEDGHDAFHAVDCPVGDDCDDSDPDVNPGADEICDGVDNNCINGIDEEPFASDSCNNDLFCDGQEYCDLGSCQDGTPVDCGDGVACTVDTCNEVSDSCDHVPTDSLCDDDLYCNGAETCHAVNGCQPGTPVDCSDGVGCTVDSCNETTDDCDNAPNDTLCDDQDDCTSDSCSPVTGCSHLIDKDSDQDGYIDDTCLGGTDCDDTNEFVNPAATEGPYGHATCTDTLDNDCDQTVDGLDTGCFQCINAAECDDTNPCTDDDCVEGGCVNTHNSNPCNDGNSCTEDDACVDGICVGSPLDADDDGYVSDGCGGDDCNDGDQNINPAAQESCDGLDNDCDAGTSDGSEETWLGQPCDGPDTDLCEEGVYECTGGEQGCTDDTGDDAEICDGLDNDCDGNVPPDEADGDEDGYMACENDCNDSEPGINPGATDTCDGTDQNCDSTDGVPEICDDGLDNDCDGLTDDDDSADCGYSAVANAEASVYGKGSLRGSGAFNEIALLFLPIGAVILLKSLRRKK